MGNSRKSEPPFSPRRLGETLFDRLLLPNHATFRVAFSGGLDSMVLLHAMLELRESVPINLSAVHVDHGLRSESREWARRCVAWCQKRNVPIDTRTVVVADDHSAGLEAAAREVRYAAMREILGLREILVTGHHLDDQAETTILQLMRGSGLQGLAAMPARVPFGRGELIRPMLEFRRVDLLDYARRNGLQWIEDPSNTDCRHRRNFVRNRVLPLMREVWPETPAVLSRAALHAREAIELLDETAETDLRQVRVSMDNGPERISIEKLGHLSAPRQRNVIRYWFRVRGFEVPTTRQLSEIENQIGFMPRSRQAVIRWPGVQVWRYQDNLVALPDEEVPAAKPEPCWKMDGTVDWPGVGRLSVQSATGSAARLRDRLVVSVRHRQGGERIRLPGRHHRHAVKKLIQSAHMPPWLRCRLPLFFAGDELVAVGDRWVSAPFAAAEGEPGFQIVWEPTWTHAALENFTGRRNP